MSVEACYTRLRASVDGARLLVDEPMAAHTTFRIGGPADLFVSAANEAEAALVCAVAREEGVPLTVVGNGSNLLVGDDGIRGVVLCLGRDFQAVGVKGDTIHAQAGASLKSVAMAALEAGLTGMEAISGIPGNVGGAVCMNAGAYDGTVSQGVVSVQLLDPKTGEVHTLTGEEMAFGYRTSLAMTRGWIVLSALWCLQADDPASIRARMDDYTRRRREKQPLQYPSAGSVFKRPEGYFAGKLIEDANLKGYTVGRAQVSTLHAGFIINLGGATARDVKELIAHIQRVVRDRFGVDLETEIREIGE